MLSYLSVLVVLLANPGLALRESSGCGTSLSHIKPGHSYTYKIQVNDPLLGENERSFRAHIPAQYVTDNNVPIPLVLDYHGWGGSGQNQEQYSSFKDVADEDEVGFLVAFPSGMDDQPGGNMGSFNCSRTDGPYGPPCDTDRSTWGEIACYSSCPNCDPSNSCDWTSCYDDIEFTRTMIQAIGDEFCIDLDSVHMTGISNGGMFSYYAISKLDDVLASIAPVAGSPLLGFGDLPSQAVNIIDVHGFQDDTIPYDHAHASGVGPMNTVISWDGYYYVDKRTVISTWVDGLGCGSPTPWATDMDGVDNWSCQLYTGCNGGKELVECTGDHGHDYPFGSGGYIQGTRIIWKFMKSHSRA